MAAVDGERAFVGREASQSPAERDGIVRIPGRLVDVFTIQIDDRLAHVRAARDEPLVTVLLDERVVESTEVSLDVANLGVGLDASHRAA